MTDIEKHFYDTMIQRIKDMQEERAKTEIHPNIIVMGEDHFHALERQAVTKCDHPHQWGSLMGGVKVFSSPHLPPDTMLVIDDLRCLADQVFMQTLIQKGYTSWTLPRPRPPFKSASQTRAAAQKAKAKARRKALRSRRRSRAALQRA